MPHALSETGTTLDDKYILLGEIESNELYSLYRAENLRLGQRVTIQLGTTSEHADSVIAAARTAATIEHENVWRVLDAGQAPSGASYVALAGLEGETLQEYVSRSGLLDESEALDVTRQLLSGLSACHARRLVHGHLSPETIWLTVAESGRTTVKLCGFGLSSGARSGRRWLAPELTQQRVDERADLYSVAGILLALLGGEPGPRGPSFPSGLRPALEALVRRGLSRVRAERPSSAEQFLEALDALGASGAEAEPPAASTTLRVAKRQRRRPIAALGVSDSLLISPRIPPAAPAPLFDSRDAAFSTHDLAEQSRALSATDTRRRMLGAIVAGVTFGVLIAWLVGLI